MTDVSQAVCIYYTALSKLTVFCRFLSALYSCSINIIYSLQYWSLKLAIISWSISYYIEVVFRGSYTIRTCKRPYKPLTNYTASSWPEKLSINRRTFLPLLSILLLSYYCRRIRWSRTTECVVFCLRSWELGPWKLWLYTPRNITWLCPWNSPRWATDSPHHTISIPYILALLSI